MDTPTPSEPDDAGADHGVPDDLLELYEAIEAFDAVNVEALDDADARGSGVAAPTVVDPPPFPQ